MNRTKIEWVKNPDGSQGYTWNPSTGCRNHVDGLCKGGGFPCYAYKLANGRLKQRYLEHANLAIPDSEETHRHLYLRNEHYRDPFYPRFWEERLSEPIENPTPMNPAKRKGIFPCDMSDLFGIGIPEIWTEQVMTTIKLCPYHRFYLLTKQPQNLIKFSPFPENCWVGVTATDSDMAFMAVGYLRLIEAKVKFISFEPLLKPVIRWVGDAEYLFKYVDWVIIGAQTKPTKLPEISWVREIVEAADKAGIPVFLKDNLKPMFGVMTSTEAIKYGGLFKPYLLEAITFNTNNEIIAHELRQEMPEEVIRVTRRQPSKHVRKVRPRITRPRKRKLLTPSKPRPETMKIGGG